MWRERGMAIGILVLTLALTAAFLAALAGMGRSGSTRAEVETLRGRIIAEGQYIRQKIQTCVEQYPDGDNGVAGDYKAWPLELPGSGYRVDLLVCPGSGKRIFDGADGQFFPIPLPGCIRWQYYNNGNLGDQVRIDMKGRSTACLAAVVEAQKVFGTIRGTSSGSTVAEARLATDVKPNDTLVLYFNGVGR